MPGRVPDWFIEARDRLLQAEARRIGESLPPADSAGDDQRLPKAGEIRLLSADDPEEPSSESCQVQRRASPVRLVLIRSLDEELGYSSVALLGYEPDLAGGTDVILPPEKTGLPYVVVAETDVVAPAWLSQLGPVEGRVDDQILVGVLETERTGVPTVPGCARGAPLRGPLDERYAFKLAEAAELQRLCASCIEALSGRAQLSFGADLDRDEADGESSEGDGPGGGSPGGLEIDTRYWRQHGAREREA